MRRIKFKPSFRQTLTANSAYLAAMSPGGVLPADLQASLERTMPKMRQNKLRAAAEKRAAAHEPNSDFPGVDIDSIHQGKRAAPVPLERDIQKAILQFLRVHPKVAWAHRFNRGMVRSEYNGRESFTQFNTCKGFSDIHFLLKDGRAGYCEVKRPGGKLTDEQATFLADCRAANALAFIATSVNEAQAALK